MKDHKMRCAHFSTALFIALSGVAHAYTCEQVITAEGAWERAQTECPLPAGVSPFQKAATACAKFFTPDKVRSLTLGGYSDWFDAHANGAAKVETCRNAAAATPIDPDSVRPARLPAIATSAANGSCLLQVDGHTYLKGRCDVDVEEGGDFMVSTPRNTSPMYFASVHLNKGSGTAIGFWNGKEAESHAHDDLGTLTRKGACWSNSRVKVCAAASQPDGKHVEHLQEFDCDQLITLYALTSTAQLQCGFSEYSQAWLARSRFCAAQVGERQFDQDLKKGIAMFRGAAREQGKTAACDDIAGSFPDAIRR